MRELRILKPIAKLEDVEALDAIVNPVKSAIVGLLSKSRPLEDVLHGTPVGHPLHPVLILVPAGAWLSAAVLDVLPGNERAAQLLVGTGLLAAVPTVATGEADWSRLHEQQMRVGVVHAAVNLTAIALYTGSWLARRRGNQGLGKLLGFAGITAISAGGYLGGHLSYRQAAGANHTEDVPHRFPSGWQPLAPLAELPERTLTRRDVAGQPLLVHRDGDQVDVISNVCSHLSGPLNEGELSTDAEGEACVTCPWHQSVFALRNGEVVHGPATSPQPAFETRVTGDLVEVLLPNAG